MGDRSEQAKAAMRESIARMKAAINAGKALEKEKIEEAGPTEEAQTE